MGRNIKRVPLDFDHPIGEGWAGYLNPHYVDCPFCNGQGENKARTMFSHAVIKMLSHHFILDEQSNKDRLALTAGLSDREPSEVYGHDSTDVWTVMKKILEAAGLDIYTWGICSHCEGDGTAKEHQVARDAWEPSGPPAGEGWQVWEDVSEGSPISPVFGTKEAVIDWVIKHQNASREAATAFVDDGWAPSFILSLGSRSSLTGVQAASTMKGEDNDDARETLHKETKQ